MHEEMTENGEGQGKRIPGKGWLAALAILILTFPLALLAALHLPSVQEWVIGQLTRRIESSSAIHVEIASYRWQPLADVYLSNIKAEFSGKEILHCEGARLTFGLSASKPYLQVKELYLEKPLIRVQRDTKGKWQVPGRIATKRQSQESRGTGAPSPWLQLPLPQVRVSAGSVFGEQDGRTILSIRQVNGTLPLRVVPGSDGPRIEIDLGRWSGRLDLLEGAPPIASCGCSHPGSLSAGALVSGVSASKLTSLAGASSFAAVKRSGS